MPEETKQQMETADQEIVSSPVKHRVKFYQLNSDTHWEDKGTGHCIYQLGTDGNPDQIIVHSEEDNSILLTSQVLRRRVYQRQQDTLIVWTEDDNRDLALSFQEISGCDEMWSCISRKQGIEGTLLTGEGDDSTPKSPKIPLPDPQLSNLKEILDLLLQANTMREKDKISAYILTEGYLNKLLSLFEECEDLESTDDLHILYEVMIAIFSLNDQQLIDLALQDDYFTNVMGILEYNPKTEKGNHREFFKQHSNIKQVIEIEEETIKRKIELSFRLEYLQTIFLDTKNSDEGLMGVINTMLHQNHLSIINYIQNNHSLLEGLEKTFHDPETPKEKKDDIIQFILQIFNLVKPMEEVVRVNTLRTLEPHGLLDIMSVALAHENKNFRLNALNILATFTDLDVNTVRTGMLMQTNRLKSVIKPLFQVIVEEAIKEDDFDLKVQYFEILRILLNNNTGLIGVGIGGHNNDGASKQIEDFLGLFYHKYYPILLKPISDLEIKPIPLTGPVEPLTLSSDQAQLCLYICEFLGFAVRNHGFQSKYLVCSSECFLKVAQLYRSKFAHVKLVALKFFRTCVSFCDDFCNTQLIDHNIFEPTIRVFLDTNGKDCLLNSACLDLLEFIRRENIKPLINHLIIKFGTVLDTITYISTCKQLRLKYEQNHEPFESKKTINETNNEDKETNTMGRTEQEMDEEEKYFNGSDEEDTPAQIPKTGLPLVTYGEDEDTEEEEEEEAAAATATATAEEDANDNEEKDKNTTEKDTEMKDDVEFKRKREEDLEGSSSPPFKLRKKSIDDDDDDEDLLAKCALRQSPITSKRIVIKTASIKKKVQ